MYTSFYIKKDRIDELKNHIRTKTKTVRFKYNPVLEGDRWHICLTMDVSESPVMNELFNVWYDLDKPKPEPKSLFKKIVDAIF